MKQITALILCAGKSTRISPISLGRPKPLIEIDQEPVLFRNLRWLAQSGIQDVWMNLHYKAEEFEKAIERQSFLKIQTIYEPKILGTAGAVKNLSKELSDPFLVISGDNIYQFDLESFYRDHLSHKNMATIALFHKQTHFHTGIAGGQVLLKESLIQGFVEGSSEDLSPYVNAGAYFFQKQILDEIPPDCFLDFGKDLFPKMVREEKKITGHLIQGFCLGIDTPESYYRAVELIERQKIS